MSLLLDVVEDIESAARVCLVCGFGDRLLGFRDIDDEAETAGE